MLGRAVVTRVTRLLIAACLLACYCKSASFCTPDPVAEDTKQALQFFAGYSPQSATLIGTTENRRFVLAGVEYSYRCWPWRNISISLTPGVLPAAILLQPVDYVYTYGRAFSAVQYIPSHAVYGFGIVPIGFTVDFARKRVIHPFFEVNGGVIVSTEPIPVNTVDATAFNFLFDFGGGIQCTVADRRALSFGYKFLHISNANRTATNPGVDNNVFYAGFSFLR